MKFNIGETIEIEGIGLKKPLRYLVTSIFGNDNEDKTVTLTAKKHSSIKRNSITLKILNK